MNRRVVCLLIDNASAIPAMAERCLSITPDVAIRPGEAIFLEISKVGLLMDEEEICRELERIAEEGGVKIKMAVAGDSRRALSLARTGGDLPICAVADYVGPFTYNPEERQKAEEIGEIFQILGIRELEDLKNIPAAAIASRFGKIGDEISRHLLRADDGPWPKFQPSEAITTEIDFRDCETLGPCTELEPMLFLLKRMVGRLLGKIRGDRIARLKLILKCEDHSRRELEIEFALPQSTLGGMIPIIREQLAAEAERSSFESAIEMIEMEALEIIPGHDAQKHLFSRREEELTKWDSLVGRLRAALGKEKAFLAESVDRHLPEKSWRLVLESPIQEQAEVIHPPSEVRRPSRLLPKPEPLILTNGALVDPIRKRRWRVTRWLGPERLSGEWWGESTFEREYYRVLTASGEELWGFYDRSGKFYLHGFFD